MTPFFPFLNLSKDKGWLFQMAELGPLDKSGNPTEVSMR